MPTSMPPSPDRPHGERLTYNRGCRCDDCRAAAARYERGRQWDILQGRRRRVDKTGTQRRLQALFALGWDWYSLSRYLGGSPELTRQWAMTKKYVYARTAERVSALYEELSMRLPPQETTAQKINVARTRNRARKYGWAPPLAWDDIDDPNERPGIHDTSPVVDPVVVERRLSGDKRVPVTKAERIEIVRRGKAAGLSLRELEERCGITKPERYIEREEAA